MPVVSLFSR